MIYERVLGRLMFASQSIASQCGCAAIGILQDENTVRDYARKSSKSVRSDYNHSNDDFIRRIASLSADSYPGAIHALCNGFLSGG